MPSNEIPIQAAREKYVETGRMDLAIEAYGAAKVAEQPCAGINKAALDQASAARKQYRADTPVSLYSIEGEDAVFVAAYLEAVKGDEQPLNAKEWGLGRGQAVITATLNAPREQPSQQPVALPAVDIEAGARAARQALDKAIGPGRNDSFCELLNSTKAAWMDVAAKACADAWGLKWKN